MPRKPKGEGSPLGERVRRERLKRGWTQNELADRANVPQANVSQIESGARTANFQSNTLLSLERALRLWPGELLAIMGDNQIAASRERFIVAHRALLSDDDIADMRRMWEELKKATATPAGGEPSLERLRELLDLYGGTSAEPFILLGIGDRSLAAGGKDGVTS